MDSSKKRSVNLPFCLRVYVDDVMIFSLFVFSPSHWNFCEKLIALLIRHQFLMTHCGLEQLEGEWKDIFSPLPIWSSTLRR